VSGAAIAGIGETQFELAGGPATAYDVTCDAARLAAADAGVSTRQIDGIVKYSYDGAMSDAELATRLGCRELTFSAEIPFGGGSPGAVLGTAAAAIATGQARTVLCYRTVVAEEWAAQLRQPDLGRPYYRDALQFLRPSGWYSYLHLFGMLAARHMQEFGTTSEQFGRVIIESREHALRAPNALRRQSLSPEEYAASPYTVEPLRELDDVVWANGGCAVIVTSAAQAVDAPNGAAHILSTGQSTGSPPVPSFEFWPMVPDMHSALRSIAGQLWAHGITPADVGSLQCYDTTPICVLLALEGLGFCEIGAGGPFVQDGGISAGGQLAVCTNGGHTSSAYIHGFSQVIEAVRRVRPSAGESPADAFSVVSGAPTTPTSAVILGAEALA
jgi:acetyl-CoA acetyltransferase